MFDKKLAPHILINKDIRFLHLQKRYLVVKFIKNEICIHVKQIKFCHPINYYCNLGQQIP